jgi:energy-coupling factor transporter ATP-binding protein EcfA2
VIRSLEIDNFRCFKSLVIPDIRRFTVITGKNGSGKTALLESLFIASGGSAEIYLRANAWRGRDLLSYAPDSVLPMFEDFFHKFDPTSGLRIRFRDSFGEEREVRVSVNSAEVIDLPFDTRVSEAMRSPNLKFTWKTPRGEFESSVETTKDGIKISQPRDVFPMVFLNQITTNQARETADRWSGISARNAEEPIEKAVRKLFPEVIRLSVLSPGGLPGVYVDVKGLDRKIPAGLLSAGVNKLIAILVAIGSSPKGAVLIDEIENGLYHKIDRPLWEAISDFAIENDAQLIVTTHSQEFLEAIAPSADWDDKSYLLLRMEKENGNVQVESFGGKEFGGAVESGFEVR